MTTNTAKAPNATASGPKLAPKQLREAIVRYVLREDSSLPDVPAIRDFLTAHRDLVAQRKKAQELLQQVIAAIFAHSPLERALEQKKKELATTEVELGKMAQALGHAAFNALLADKIGQLPVFAERLALHRKIADLEAEKLALTPPESAGMVQKAKAKAQQMVSFGRIKLVARSEGSLETAIGKNLLHNNQEETVRCDQTNGILDAICKHRSNIASCRSRVSEAQAAVENKRAELCQSLGLAKIEGATTLDAELRTCQSAINQKEKERRDLENALPDKLLAEADMPHEGRLAELLTGLWQTVAVQVKTASPGSKCDPARQPSPIRKSLAGIPRQLFVEALAVCVATRDQTVRLAAYSFKRFKGWRTGKGEAVVANDALWPSDRIGWRRIGVGYALVALLVLVGVAFIGGPGGTNGGQGATTGRQGAGKSDRVLVFIVPGTYGNAEFWPNRIEGQVTFGSQLLSALKPGSEVYPFLWASSLLDHSNRVQAAQNLADLIDRRSASFDRVCLVGHSHGGNVALLAARICRSKVDTIVCLSTPHTYLRTRTSEGRDLLLPVYCSASFRSNVDHIITITPNIDSVPDGWANLADGLSENDAIRLTRGWQEANGYPRLADDGALFRFFGSSNILATKFLPSIYDTTTNKGIVNCPVLSEVQGVARAHSAIHSRRMGYVIGKLLHDRAESQSVDYMRHMIQPEGEDEGDPISAEDQARSVSSLGSKCEHAGWLLRKITVHVDPSAKEAVNESNVNPFVRLTFDSGPTNGVRKETERQMATMDATWNLDWFVQEGTTFELDVLHWNLIRSIKYLGGWHLSSTPGCPPEQLDANASAGIYSSASLEWLPVHY